MYDLYSLPIPQLPREVVAHRGQWDHGATGIDTALANKANVGWRFCALGFLGLAMGLTPEQMDGRQTLSDALAMSGNSAWPYTAEGRRFSQWQSDIIQLNDCETYCTQDQPELEALLAETAAEMGITLRFED